MSAMAVTPTPTKENISKANHHHVGGDHQHQHQHNRPKTSYSVPRYTNRHRRQYSKSKNKYYQQHHHNYQFYGNNHAAFAYPHPHRGAFMSPPPSLYLQPSTFQGMASSWSNHVAFQEANNRAGFSHVHPMTAKAMAQAAREGVVMTDDFRKSLLNPTAEPFVPKIFKTVDDATTDKKPLAPLADKTNQNEDNLSVDASASDFIKKASPPPGFVEDDKKKGSALAPPGFSNLVSPDQQRIAKQSSPVTVITPLCGWDLPTKAAVITPATHPTVEAMKQQEEICTEVAASIVSEEPPVPTPRPKNYNAWSKPLVAAPKTTTPAWSSLETEPTEDDTILAGADSPTQWPSLTGTAITKTSSTTVPIAEEEEEDEEDATEMESSLKTEPTIVEEQPAEDEEEEEEEKEKPIQYSNLKPMDMIRQKMGLSFVKDPSGPMEW